MGWYRSTALMDRKDPRAGRRYRAFRHALTMVPVSERYGSTAEMYAILSSQSDERFAKLPFAYKNAADPELHLALQDLGWMINLDISQACAAFDDPDVWYPGVDPPDIEPVPDTLIEKVIPALQRELNRELRSPTGTGAFIGDYKSLNLPAAPLAELPWRIQRAIVERRRYRFKQWGLSEADRLAGVFSLWQIPDDPEWVPPWL